MLDALPPVPIIEDVIKLFMLDSAFSKCVPPDPSVEFAEPTPPLSRRLASCCAKLVMVEPRRLVVCPTEQELPLPADAVHRLTMNGYNPTLNSLLIPVCPSYRLRSLLQKRRNRIADGVGL